MQSESAGRELTEATEAILERVSMRVRRIRMRTEAGSELAPSLPPPHPASVLFNRRRVTQDAGLYSFVRGEPDAA
jgi:hypothetical protein